jgi:hypothetical protein
MTAYIEIKIQTYFIHNMIIQVFFKKLNQIKNFSISHKTFNFLQIN